MEYRIIVVNGHVEVLDRTGRFLFSADTEQEAQQDNPSAQEELGERYLFGLNGLDADPAKAKELYRKACDKGDRVACERYARLQR